MPFHYIFPPEAHQALDIVLGIALLTWGCQGLRLLGAALAWLCGGAR